MIKSERQSEAVTGGRSLPPTWKTTCSTCCNIMVSKHYIGSSWCDFSLTFDHDEHILYLSHHSFRLKKFSARRVRFHAPCVMQCEEIERAEPNGDSCGGNNGGNSRPEYDNRYNCTTKAPVAEQRRVAALAVRRTNRSRR